MDEKPVMPPVPVLTKEQIVKDQLDKIARKAWADYHFEFLKYTVDHHQPPNDDTWMGTFKNNIQITTLFAGFCITTNIWGPSPADASFHTFLHKE